MKDKFRLILFPFNHDSLLQGSPGNLTQFEDVLFASSSSTNDSSSVLSCKLATSEGATVSYEKYFPIEFLFIETFRPLGRWVGVDRRAELDDKNV